MRRELGLLYRGGFWVIRYLRPRDILQALMLLAASLFLVSMSFSHPTLALLVGGIYFVVMSLVGADVILSRRAKDQAQAEILRLFLAQMNREVFNNDENVRFTLFKVSPFNPKYIVPWYRYRKNVRDVIREASRSNARYRKNEGFTGYVWAKGEGDLIYASFPPFANRPSFDKYYTHELHIDQSAVRRISNEMVKVRTIMSCAFLDGDEFIGLLSIDLYSAVELTTKDPFPKVQGKYLYADLLSRNLQTIQVVLSGFWRFDKTI